MGKNGKRKRQKNSSSLAVVVPIGSENITFEDESDESITDDALVTTIQTLQKISPSNLQDKRFKALRRVIHPLVLQQLQSYDQGTDYRIKATQALQNRKWTDALAALQGCRDFQQHPKQGTIQRWVRDCDLAPDTCKLLLLNAILVVNQHDLHEDGSEINKHDPRLAIAQHLSADTNVNANTTSNIKDEDEKLEGQGQGQHPVDSNQTHLTIMEHWGLSRLMQENEDFDKLPEITMQSRILYREAAADRKPPNHFDLHLHTTEPASIQWSSDPYRIVKHEVPFLKSQKGVAFVLENVLTLEECQQLRAGATTLGFRPDHPVTMEHPTGIDSCEWLVDDSILSVINTRVQPFLQDSDPSLVTQSAVFHSINPRWRFFRYGQGCVYRPHIDGSWPASRIHPQTGNYESYSEDEQGATIKSFHTFLVYLNDNFEGGQTRFYFPRGGGLVAQGVTPKCGSVLVFSQGNMASLLHEGSAVTSGTKYVVRTDVLYRTPTHHSST